VLRVTLATKATPEQVSRVILEPIAQSRATLAQMVIPVWLGPKVILVTMVTLESRATLVQQEPREILVIRVILVLLGPKVTRETKEIQESRVPMVILE
jgi:hypothetical protein